MSGKLKMVVQCVAVAGSLLYLEYGRGSPNEQSLAIGRDVLLWAAVVSHALQRVRVRRPRRADVRAELGARNCDSRPTRFVLDLPQAEGSA